MLVTFTEESRARGDSMYRHRSRSIFRVRNVLRHTTSVVALEEGYRSMRFVGCCAARGGVIIELG
jgi:hypothetical protein